MIFNAFLHANYHDNDGYVASNSPNGFHRGVIKGRNWLANEMHSNMISIINFFDLIITYSRPRHFSKDVFICVWNLTKSICSSPPPSINDFQCSSKYSMLAAAAWCKRFCCICIVRFTLACRASSLASGVSGMVVNTDLRFLPSLHWQLLPVSSWRLLNYSALQV